MAAYTRTLQYELGRLSGTLLNGVPQLDAQGAANKWAGTTGLGLQGALAVKAGRTSPTNYLSVRALCNQLGGTTNQDEGFALSQI